MPFTELFTHFISQVNWTLTLLPKWCEHKVLHEPAPDKWNVHSTMQKNNRNGAL